MVNLALPRQIACLHSRRFVRLITRRIMEASSVMKDFMVANTRSDTLLMFSDMAGADGYESNADIPFSTLLPSFITSELKTAFQIGFLLFLPCPLYTSPSPRDRTRSRMPSSA